MGVSYRHPALGLSWAGSGETEWCRRSPLNRGFSCGWVFLGRSEGTLTHGLPGACFLFPNPFAPHSWPRGLSPFGKPALGAFPLGSHSPCTCLVLSALMLWLARRPPGRAVSAAGSPARQSARPKCMRPRWSKENIICTLTGLSCVFLSYSFASMYVQWFQQFNNFLLRPYGTPDIADKL